MATKLTLDIQAVPDVHIIGISSHVNDYRLCWALNKRLGISMARRDKDIQRQVADGTATHSAFDHVDDTTDCTYTLVSNRSEHGPLVKEQRAADYFFVVERELRPDAHALLDDIRHAEFVLAVFPLAYSELRAGFELLC